MSFCIGISVYETLRSCTCSLCHSVSTSYVDNVSFYPRTVRLLGSVVLFAPRLWLHLQMITAVSLSSSSYGYSRFVVFIFRWLQPFCCLHLQVVTAVSLFSSSDGYSRFVLFIFRWLQPFRYHLQMVIAVSLSSSLDGYSRFAVFILRWLQTF